MNASHTPGPWNLDETTGVNMAPVYLIESAEGQSIATVKKQADALLIRSAPSLLAQRDALRAALEAMLQADDAICENIGSKSDQAMQRIAALDQARAAIIIVESSTKD